MAKEEKVKLDTIKKINDELQKQKKLLDDGRKTEKTRKVTLEKILELEQMLVDKQQVESSLAKQILGDIKAREKANTVLNSQSGGFVSLSKELNDSAKKGFELIRNKIDSEGNLKEVYTDQYETIQSIVSGTNDLDGISKLINQSKAKEEELNKEGLTDQLESQRNVGRILDIEKKRLQLKDAEKAKTELLDKVTGGLASKAKEFAKLIVTNPKVAAFVALGAIIAGIVKAATAFSNQITQIGKSFGFLATRSPEVSEALRISSIQAGLLGKGMSEVVEITETLSSQFGVSIDEAAKLSFNVAETASALGLADGEAAKLFGSFMDIGGLTAGQAEDLIKSTGALAAMNGVAPRAVLQDIAGSAESMARLFQEGSDSLVESSIAARKLGVNLDSVVGAMKSSLDFQSSVSSELEASAILGRRINLTRARQLALEKDSIGFQKEIVKQLGSQTQFQRMSFIEQDALAKATGFTVEQIAKMVGETEKLTMQSALAGRSFEEILGTDGLGTVQKLVNEVKLLGGLLIEAFGPSLLELLERFTTYLKSFSGIDTANPFENLQNNIREFRNEVADTLKAYALLATVTGAVLIGTGAGALLGTGVAASGIAAAAIAEQIETGDRYTTNNTVATTSVQQSQPQLSKADLREMGEAFARASNKQLVAKVTNKQLNFVADGGLG